MKTSEKIVVAALAVGLGCAGGLYWLSSALPWWAYLGVGVISAGAAYEQWLKLAAHKTLADREGTDKH